MDYTLLYAMSQNAGTIDDLMGKTVSVMLQMYGDPVGDYHRNPFRIRVSPILVCRSSIIGRYFHKYTSNGWIHSKMGVEAKYEPPSITNRATLRFRVITDDRVIL